jgi:hypothetical protein
MFPLSRPDGGPLTNFHWRPLNDDDKANLVTASVLTSSFYVVGMVMQRVMGLVRLHGGRSKWFTSVGGFVLTTSSLLVAQKAESMIRLHSNNYGYQVSSSNLFGWPFVDQFMGGRNEKHRELKDTVRRLYLGLASFVILEQGLFRTPFPSSVLTLGVFANGGNMLRRSVMSTSAVATDAQRQKIQSLGRRFGCHHCGSRQLFSRATFIADHMPPTKQANEMADAWWRKFFKIQVCRLVNLGSRLVVERVLSTFVCIRLFSDCGLNVSPAFNCKGLRLGLGHTGWPTIMHSNCIIVHQLLHFSWRKTQRFKNGWIA